MAPFSSMSISSTTVARPCSANVAGGSAGTKVSRCGGLESCCACANTGSSSSTIARQALSTVERLCIKIPMRHAQLQCRLFERDVTFAHVRVAGPRAPLVVGGLVGAQGAQLLPAANAALPHLHHRVGALGVVAEGRLAVGI